MSDERAEKAEARATQLGRELAACGEELEMFLRLTEELLHGVKEARLWFLSPGLRVEQELIVARLTELIARTEGRR